MMNLKRKLALDVCLNRGLNNSNFDSIYKNMWRNIREDGGYRLTDEGYKLLDDIGLKSYTIPLFDEKLKIEIKTGNILIGLDKQLKVPYYIKNSKLKVFDDNISTQLILYGGDIKAYLNANS